ncbi:hypothetical protein F5882DRAFT_148806 [Hyaloscypha sp. PMI_1271]|nr:hypothetical protein F5882DRAFT_148806 [Hyaloscypha sp. PMI_1271]
MAEDEAKERSAERAVESIAMLPVLTDSSGIFVSRLAAKSTEAHISHAPIAEVRNANGSSSAGGNGKSLSIPQDKTNGKQIEKEPQLYKQPEFDTKPLAALENALQNLASELRKANAPQSQKCSNCGCKGGESGSDADFFYKNIGTVAALGASITFALIISDIKDPHEISQHGRFDLSTVRILLAVSWMLFMIVLSLSFSLAQKFKHESAEEDEEKKDGPTGLATVVYVLELGAVMCLSLVVAAYVEIVGYIMVALVSIVVVALALKVTALRWLDKWFDNWWYMYGSSDRRGSL